MHFHQEKPVDRSSSKESTPNFAFLNNPSEHHRPNFSYHANLPGHQNPLNEEFRSARNSRVSNPLKLDPWNSQVRSPEIEVPDPRKRYSSSVALHQSRSQRHDLHSQHFPRAMGNGPIRQSTNKPALTDFTDPNMFPPNLETSDQTDKKQKLKHLLRQVAIIFDRDGFFARVAWIKVEQGINETESDRITSILSNLRE